MRGQHQAPATLPLGKDPVPIVQEAGWAPGPVWTGTENLAPTGIQSQTIQPVASRYTDYATRPTPSCSSKYYGNVLGVQHYRTTKKNSPWP